jgi:hypothetical protein
MRSQNHIHAVISIMYTRCETTAQRAALRRIPYAPRTDVPNIEHRRIHLTIERDVVDVRIRGSRRKTPFRQPSTLMHLNGQGFYELRLTTGEFDSPDSSQENS